MSSDASRTPAAARPDDGDLRGMAEGGQGAEAQARILGQLLDAVGQAVIATDLEGRIVYWNPSAERIYGWSADEVLGRDIMEVTPSPGMVERAEEIMATLREGRAWSGEFELRRRDGSTFPAQVTDAPLRNEDGELVGIVGISTDISERARLERALEIERKRLADAFTRAPAFMAILRGPEHVFEMANPRYVQVVGGRDLMGKTVREALPELEGQGYFERLDEVFRTGEPYVGREEVIAWVREPGGEPREGWLDFVFQPLRQDDGSVYGVLVHGVDVSDTVRSRRELERLYAEVQHANQAKSDFLAVISHELRTPLTAILGYTDILEAGIGGTLNDKQRQHLSRIAESGRHLLELIEEILAYARAEAGQDVPRPQDISLSALLEECAVMLDGRAHAKGLRIERSLPPGDAAVRTDPRMLRQIVINLLSNAVKFTEEGEVAVEGEVEGDHAVVRVRDTGIGIAPEDLERVFEPFRQVDEVLTRAAPGTGLGLAVVRKLAGLLGGEVSAESAPGGGSTFTVWIAAHLGERD